MRALIASGLLAMLPVMAAAETCETVQLRHQFCQEAQRWTPLGERADGRDYFQAAESFSRVYTIRRPVGSPEMAREIYLRTLRTEVTETSPLIVEDAHASFGLSIAQSGAQADTVVVVSFVPTGSTTLLVETVFQDDGLAISDERLASHRGFMDRLQVAQ